MHLQAVMPGYITQAAMLSAPAAPAPLPPLPPQAAAPAVEAAPAGRAAQAPARMVPGGGCPGNAAQSAAAQSATAQSALALAELHIGSALALAAAEREHTDVVSGPPTPRPPTPAKALRPAGAGRAPPPLSPRTLRARTHAGSSPRQGGGGSGGGTPRKLLLGPGVDEALEGAAAALEHGSAAAAEPGGSCGSSGAQESLRGTRAAVIAHLKRCSVLCGEVEGALLEAGVLAAVQQHLAQLPQAQQQERPSGTHQLPHSLQQHQQQHQHHHHHHQEQLQPLVQEQRSASRGMGDGCVGRSGQAGDADAGNGADIEMDKDEGSDDDDDDESDDEPPDASLRRHGHTLLCRRKRRRSNPAEATCSSGR